MPQTIIFDLFGVLARIQTEEAKRRIEALAGVPGPAFWEAYWAGRPAYDAGQRGADYWAQVATRLGVRFAPDMVTALIETDLESWTEADDRMVELVAELAGQGRSLGLLSNIIADLVPLFERRHAHWLRHFTARTYSCRIGVAKPDPRAYRICAEQLGVDPRDALFFDDDERNVVAARAAGMPAEVFVSPDQVRRRLGL
ncbi:MAG TPA: HAD family phosphatase [Streptosporangiaceae bacterium]|nr:HAD family phosphatase [Streptosporangiaceae bacterium]